jgi:hypothetical protein
LSTLKRLPSQYSLLDHIVFLYRRTNINSVKEFYSLLFTKAKIEDLEEHAGTISFAEIKHKYEKYCFLKHYPELNMLSEMYNAYLMKKGYHYEKKADNSTLVFQKIRFLNDKESIKAKSEYIDPDLSSLEAFLNRFCILTQFDQDSVSVDEFKARYCLVKC